MKSKLIFLYLMVFFIYGPAGSQTQVGDYLDLVQLERSVVQPLTGLNTGQIEFAPAYFQSGLVYVYSDTEKKRVKKSEELHFKLKFNALDENSIMESTDFFPLGDSDLMEGPCSFSPDGRSMFITRNVQQMTIDEGNNEMKLGIFIYQLVDSLWEYREALPVNSTRYNVCHPAWDEGESRLLFASDMPGGFGRLDLYAIERTKTGEWGMPENLGASVNSMANDCFPFMHNGQFLYFSSDREQGFGGLDIYASVETDQDWLEATCLPIPLNSAADDLGLIVSPNGEQIIFASSRPGGEGKDDLYRIKLQKSFIIRDPDYHTIKVFHALHGGPVPDAKIKFYKYDISDPAIDISGNRISGISYQIRPESLKGSKEYRSNQQGELFLALAPGEYILEAGKSGFYPKQMILSIPRGGQQFSVGLDTVQPKNFSLRMTDAVSGKDLDSVSISFQAVSLDLGSSTRLNDLRVSEDQPFRASISRKHYQSDTLQFSYNDIADGQELILALQPMEKYVSNLPTRTGEIRILKNILYDFDQYQLTESAKRELDSLSIHMKKYPGITIELSAHTDSRGSEIYNQFLSEKRAAAARDYLVKKGINAQRIEAIGYGESRMINNCPDGSGCDEKLHAQNRRTEVKVISTRK